MPEKYISGIAFYWCNRDAFYGDYEKRLTGHLAAFEKGTGYPLTESLRMRLTDSFWRNCVAPWDFNQALGWIRLYKLGPQIRGELWYMNAKRAGRQLTKKQFSSQGKAFELHVCRAFVRLHECQSLPSSSSFGSLTSAPESADGRRTS